MNFVATPAMTRQRAEEIAGGFDLRALPEDFYSNPYPVYRVLRETQPVRRMPDGSFFLTRYADLVSVYADAQSFSSDKKVEFTPKYNHGPYGSDGSRSPLLEHHTTSLVFNDPPLHTRVRKLIMGALTRRAIAGMEPDLQVLVERLLDAIERKGSGDLIGDFACAIPVEIIGNLLNIPHEDRGPLRGWSLAILGALEPKLTPQQEALGNRSVTEFTAYLRNLLAQRRRQPGDPEHDVLTRLLQGESDAGDHLSESELLHNCVFILNAGHETTTNLIGNALVALQEWPDAKAALLKKLPQRLDLDLSVEVEEFLRFESSNQLGNRRATRATSLGGVALPEGALVTLGIGAANRDPAKFADPDRLDLARADNRHLAFGFGIHQCAGLNLARLEARIAIAGFLRRFPAYRLSANPTRGGRARFRGFLQAPFAVA